MVLMKKPFNPYDILGVDSKTDKAEIKKQYRKKAQKLHPDKGGDNDSFSDLNKAYALLFDDRKRKMYDSIGATEHNPNAEGWNILCNHFLRILRDNNMESLQNNNILDKLRNLCKQDKLSLSEKKKDAVKELKKLQEVKMRLKSSNNNNPLHFLLNEHINRFSNQMVDIDRQKKCIKNAMKLIDKFIYEFDRNVEMKLDGFFTKNFFHQSS